MRLLRAWLKEQAGLAACELTPASGDASFRRYFRAVAGGQSFIVMDAPPDKEDCRPFIKVAALLWHAGLHAPEILAQDLRQGFLLLTDLGAKTYLDVLTPDNADELFGDAIDTLIRWQLASRPDVLPPYDQALLARELNLFTEWYLPKHLRVALDAESQAQWEAVCTLLIESALAQPCVYVHRDYMPRNLMLSNPNPGVLDFQDAVFGPITYDAVCLYRDAFVSWPEERVDQWSRRYWERARAAGLPAPATFVEFRRAFDWMGLQRHLKVLGIFARLTHRDGKPAYVKDTPRFVRYVTTIAPRYTELAPLARLFERHVLPNLPGGEGGS
ncbi:MAG: aminoglycoside phosphotransferase family protein [Gammaproteobacteria bacterium]